MHSKLKIIVYIYIFLIIFENIFRKWGLSSFSSVIPLIKEPFAFYLIYIGLFHKWLNNFFCISIMSLGFITFILTLLFGHQNIIVAIYGAKIWIINIPVAFSIAHILNKNDLQKISKYILYAAIPIIILALLQSQLPPESILNKGVGDSETSLFEGRASSIFSYAGGYVYYLSIVLSILLFYLLNYNKQRNPINRLILYICIILYIISIPFSVSRTHLYLTIFSLVSIIIGSYQIKEYRSQINKFILIIPILLLIIYSLNFTSSAQEKFSNRFEVANNIEGKNNFDAFYNRTIKYRFQAIGNINAIPVAGYGTGMGTNVGSKLLGGKDMFSFFNAENEWSRVINESGFYIGILIIMWRIILTIFIIKIGWKALSQKKDLFIWCLIVPTSIFLISSQLGNPTSLGFLTLTTSLILTRYKVLYQRSNHKIHHI